jgi:hypothetical protein
MSSTLIDFIRGSLRQLHGSYKDAVSDLTDEQLHWRANERGHTGAFVLWHYYRTEDNIINFVLQHKPTAWMAGGWNEKFGMDKAAQGTGFSLADAQNLRIPSKDDWLTYQRQVWDATEAYFDTLDDAALEAQTMVKPLGEMPVQNAIGQMCLTHGFTHLGEIQHLRGLLGLKGMPV